MSRVPFALRRPWLLLRDLVVDRDRPPLERLAAIDDPEGFVWAVLPHAARTFSACIALLPAPVARAAAVGYLYCRSLDTYEDLVEDVDERQASLRRFAGRLHDIGPLRLEAAPAIATPAARDERDRAHLLLVERHGLVDRVFLELEAWPRELIRTLVTDMAAGMIWSTRTFARQGGVLQDEDQLARYCRNVLGHPVLFASRLARWHQTGTPTLPDRVAEDAMRVGEMIQLANVTRDIEKDLARGVAYHPLLRHDLGAAAGGSGGRERRAGGRSPARSSVPDTAPAATETACRDAASARAERVRRVRRDLLGMALERAPAYRRLVAYLGSRPVSATRASGVLMLLFTDRYFRSCARRAGVPAWPGLRSGAGLILASLPAVLSRSWADRTLARIERRFLEAAGSPS